MPYALNKYRPRSIQNNQNPPPKFADRNGRSKKHGGGGAVIFD